MTQSVMGRGFWGIRGGVGRNCIPPAGVGMAEAAARLLDGRIANPPYRKGATTMRRAGLGGNGGVGLKIRVHSRNSR